MLFTRSRSLPAQTACSDHSSGNVEIRDRFGTLPGGPALGSLLHLSLNLCRNSPGNPEASRLEMEPFVGTTSPVDTEVQDHDHSGGFSQSA
jgi:hypothetical protein